MAFQTELSVYFDGRDDGVERLALRRRAEKPKLSLVMPKTAIQLRDYQEAAAEQCLWDLQTNRSSLIVLATGLGKTILFCKLVEQWEGRVLVLAHLEELLQNAREDLASITGEPVGIERAKDHHEGERIVVGLIQSVSRRLKHFSPDHFQYIIVDEAHHAASEAYGRDLSSTSAQLRLSDLLQQMRVLMVQHSPSTLSLSEWVSERESAKATWYLSVDEESSSSPSTSNE
jgi:superfamily II DNA or RNA helicase